MRLVLHIGTEKTGTTSFQQWLHKNADILREQGIFYSRVLGRPNNRKISVYARDSDKPDDGFSMYGITGPEAHARFREELREDFAREVAEARESCHTFVISNEHLHSRITSGEMVSRVDELLGGRFKDIQILCCLRPQLDLLISYMSVQVRTHRIRRDFLEIDGTAPYYNYLALWNRWRKLSSNFTVVPFKRCPDIVEGLAEIIGISTGNCEKPNRVNEKLDYRTAALAWHLDMPRFIDGAPNYTKEFYVNRLPVDEPISISRAQAERVQAHFNEGNAEFVAQSGLIEIEDLTPNYAKYPEQGNFEKIFEPISFAPFLQQTVIRLNIRLWMEKSLRHTVEAERALARRRPENAEKFLDQARTCLKKARQTDLGDEDWTAEATELQGRIKGLARIAAQARKVT